MIPQIIRPKIHEIGRNHWPYSWQRLWTVIQLITYEHDCTELYRCVAHDGGVVEFKSMNEMDTYARALHRIDVGNGEEHRNVDGSYNWGRYLIP